AIVDHSVGAARRQPANEEDEPEDGGGPRDGEGHHGGGTHDAGTEDQKGHGEPHGPARHGRRLRSRAASIHPANVAASIRRRTAPTPATRPGFMAQDKP